MEIKMELRQSIIKVNGLTPAEKVKDLLSKFYQAEIALICVEEVLKVLDDTDSFCSGYTPFWETVREILSAH